MSDEPKRIVPQEGPQRAFLECEADFAIYGGAAGGGKTFALLLDAVRWTGDPKYRGVIFRRESVQITTEGGLWHESQELYRIAGGQPVTHPKPKWTFESGAVIGFHHLQHEKNKYDHQGGQYSFIGFDELTHFTETQFIYLMSRNRSSANMEPYVRATCNPDADSWVYKWVQPFLKDDGKTPDPDKCGTIKHFTVDDGSITWVDKDWRDYDEAGNEIKPKTFTFIPALPHDNEYLKSGYIASLRAQSKADQERLLRGKWVTEMGKALFRHHDIQIVERSDVPKRLRWARYWDLADTEVNPKDQDIRKADGPDWTAGAKCTVWHPPESSEHYDPVDQHPILIVSDVVYDQKEGSDKQNWMRRTAQQDGVKVVQVHEREGGSSGKEVAREYNTRVFRGFTSRDERPTGDKVERAKPWRALAENGRVWFVKGAWNADVLWWVEHFPHGKKDAIDAISGGHSVAGKYRGRTDSSNKGGRALGSFANPFG